MADDWQPGDLALCLKTGSCLRAGCIYTVEKVIGPVWWQSGGQRSVWHGVGLILRGRKHPANKSKGGAYGAKWFRKIHPHTPDAEDTETIELYRRAPMNDNAWSSPPGPMEA